VNDEVENGNISLLALPSLQSGNLACSSLIWTLLHMLRALMNGSEEGEKRENFGVSGS
jgi:hypothetical protein